MKSIGSVKEDLVLEKRVSITPETVKKFNSINISVLIEKNMRNILVYLTKSIKKMVQFYVILPKKFFKKQK